VQFTASTSIDNRDTPSSAPTGIILFIEFTFSLSLVEEQNGRIAADSLTVAGYYKKVEPLKFTRQRLSTLSFAGTKNPESINNSHSKGNIKYRREDKHTSRQTTAPENKFIF
jgi:hypothetical protein